MSTFQRQVPAEVRCGTRGKDEAAKKKKGYPNNGHTCLGTNKNSNNIILLPMNSIYFIIISFIV